MAIQEDSPEINADPEFWKDLEIPYEIYLENWSAEYEKRLMEIVERGGFSNTLPVIWEFIPDAGTPEDDEAMLRTILRHDRELGALLFACRQFGYRKRAEYIDSVYEKLDVESESPVSNFYSTLKDKGKTDKILMVYLHNEGLLKDSYILQYCYGKKPKSFSESDIPLSEISDLEEGEILDVLEADSRAYSLWHEFENQGKKYVAIKRHYQDGVERQVGGNQELEEAEFVILKFRSDKLEVFSEEGEVANRARQGVNNSFVEEDDDEVHYEEPDEDVDGEELGTAVSEISEMTEDDDSPLVVTGMDVANSPLQNNPEVHIKDDTGVLPAIRQLAQKNIDLLEYPENIEEIRVDFEGRKYKLKPKKIRSGEEGELWRLVYNSTKPSDEERDEFEQVVKEEIGIRPLYTK